MGSPMVTSKLRGKGATIVCWTCTFLGTMTSCFSLEIGALVEYLACSSYSINGIGFNWVLLIE